MPTKTNPTESNVNANNNTNNVNVNVNLKQPRRVPAKKKKEEPNWWTRTIIGGIIALVLSVCGYYIKNSMDKDNSHSTTAAPVVNPIEANH